YTYTNADDMVGMEVRRPMHTASLLVDQRFFADRLAIGASLIFNGDQLDSDFRNFFVTFAEERSLVEGYTLFNVNLRLEVDENLQLYARAENLTDEDYQESISFATPGRSVYAGVRYRFASSR
ncbi:MAG: TonB-dependent receptor, partial [Pseudomonadota bacterium]